MEAFRIWPPKNPKKYPGLIIHISVNTIVSLKSFVKAQVMRSDMKNNLEGISKKVVVHYSEV